MPTSKLFSQCPPFPSGMPVIDLPIISLEDLRQPKLTAAATLFDACRHYGFFLLDLRDSHLGAELLESAESMFDLTTSTFDLDDATLNQYRFKPPKDYNRYKPAGTMKTGNGQMDNVKVYTIAQDEILGSIHAKPHPRPIEDRWNDCAAFCTRAHNVATIILDALDTKLGLSKGTLKGLTDPKKRSDTALRWCSAAPQGETSAPDPNKPSFGAHTDIGLITLLFNVAGGLQTLPSGLDNVDGNWRFIRPQQDCALVNLGDTLVEWTGGVVQSSLHRVVDPPGPQGSLTRVSVVYLARPNLSASMRRLRGDGSVIPEPVDGEEATGTVEEWVNARSQQILDGILRPRTFGGAAVMAVH